MYTLAHRLLSVSAANPFEWSFTGTFSENSLPGEVPFISIELRPDGTIEYRRRRSINSPWTITSARYLKNAPIPDYGNNLLVEIIPVISSGGWPTGVIDAGKLSLDSPRTVLFQNAQPPGSTLTWTLRYDFFPANNPSRLLYSAQQQYSLHRQP